MTARGLQVKTVIGFGSKKEGTEGVHGAPLGAEDVKHVKAKFGFNPGEQTAACNHGHSISYRWIVEEEEEWGGARRRECG